MLNVANRVLAAGLSLVAVWFAVISTAATFKGFVARRWPTVHGIVQSSRVYASSYRYRGGRKVALIRYAYKIGSDSFTSTRLTFARGLAVSTLFGPPADSVVGARPPGASVLVHYNPTDPTDAVLFPASYLAGGADEAVAVVFLFLCFWAFKGRLTRWPPNKRLEPTRRMIRGIMIRGMKTSLSLPRSSGVVR